MKASCCQLQKILLTQIKGGDSMVSPFFNTPFTFSTNSQHRSFLGLCYYQHLNGVCRVKRELVQQSDSILIPLLS